MVLRAANGTTWGLHFFHETKEQVGRKPQRVAYATLHRGPCAEPIMRPCETPGGVTETATCYFKDDFSRRTGRRVALTRAIQRLGLSHAERAELWDLYLKYTGLRKP